MSKDIKTKQLYIIPDYKNIQKSLEIAREYDCRFEYNDFYHPDILEDEIKLEERIEFYKSLGRDMSQDTMHGAFLDMVPHSSDPAIRDVSRRRMRQSMDIASKMGLRAVIFHTNTIPNFYTPSYLDNWLRDSLDFYSQLLDDYPKLSIYIENMFDIRYTEIHALSKSLRELDPSKAERFGICLDYAHASSFSTNGDRWVQELGDHIKHIHINDNDLCDDLHMEIGCGQIDWKKFTSALETANIEPSILIEILDMDKADKSLEFMQDEGVYPFN